MTVYRAKSALGKRFRDIAVSAADAVEDVDEAARQLDLEGDTAGKRQLQKRIAVAMKALAAVRNFADVVLDDD